MFEGDFGNILSCHRKCKAGLTRDCKKNMRVMVIKSIKQIVKTEVFNSLYCICILL